MDKIEERNKELLEEIEKLKRKVKTLKTRKKYGLVWEEEKEPEQIVLDCQYKIPILKEVSAKKIIIDKKKPMNILIEGDNYHALSVLNYTHKGKIDVIYIDPPYNTGKAEEWKYNDKYVDENDAYRHSKWLNFMEKRLKLSKDLLKNDGVIFISIDDHEVYQLKLLMDNIFGAENFINNFMWLHGKGKKTKQSRTLQQYNLCYAKNKSLLNKWLDYKITSGKFANPDNDSRGPWFSGSISFSEERSNKKHSNYYEIISPSGKKWLRQWQCSKEEMEEYLKDNRIYFGPAPSYKNVPRLKIFPFDSKEIIPSNILDNHGTTRGAQKALDDIIGKDSDGKPKFENPKPKELISHFLKIVTKSKDIIVLDFFAGSGTTGHAVLELNKEDGGNRKFILCTNNENNICTDVCYPRIEKVIKGYKNLRGEKVGGLGGNLRYFKTELLDVDHISHVSDEQKIKLTYRAGEMIALREDTFEEVEKNEWWQIFKNETKYTAIYFKEDKSRLNELVNKLEKLDEKVALYIFSWGKNEYKNEFTEYKNIRVNDIPEPIIDVYKEVNRL